MRYTGHVDRYAQEHLPPPDRMPEFLFTLPGMDYPERLNAAHRLLDRHVHAGDGARRALVAPGGIDWTYHDLYRAANRIAHVLRDDFGIEPGNRVLLRIPNSPMLAACWFAVLKAGAIAVTTMAMYRETELRVVIAKARVSLAICDERLLDEMERAVEGGGPRIVSVHSSDHSAIDLRMATKHEHFTNADTAAEDVAAIAFTSGTTGAPKAAMHFHRDLLAACDSYGKHVLKLRRDDLICGTPPLAFTFGLGGLLLFPLDAGAATLLVEKAGAEDLLRLIDEFGVTAIFTAPIAYRAMIDLAGTYDISTLRTCVSAGEALPRSVFESWEASTGLKILDGIGSTEMLHIFIGSPLEEVRAGSTGRPVPGYVAEIHTEDGTPLPPGQAGRLAVKGPTGCKYLDDDRQAVYVHDGWNYPGDTYRMDEDGYFWYVARADDMIVTSGYNVSGPEVEQALLVHEHVKEVAVVGKPDPERGTHIVKAYVVMVSVDHHHEQKAEELREHVKKIIAPFKAPREIEFVHELPRTETGKLQRFKLRQRASAE
jgi:2-aminobenzoate-CoA ligase